MKVTIFEVYFINHAVMIYKLVEIRKENHRDFEVFTKERFTSKLQVI
jgi:hypothetical protein